MKSEKTRGFISGVMVLTAANLITKIIGLIYKIPLTDMLGNEGMGYFNTAYQIYTWLYMISTAGLPVALSLMVSEYDALGKHELSEKLFRIVFPAFASLGLIGSIVLFFFSEKAAALISADKSAFCITAIAPALFFVCVCSTVRGFFQGKRNMIPTAVSEIIEAFIKLTAGITLGTYAQRKGYPIEVVSAYAIFGITLGIILGASFLAVYYFLFRAGERKFRSHPEARIENENVFPSHPAPDFHKTRKTPSENEKREADGEFRHTPEIKKTEYSGKKIFGTFLKIAIPVMLSSSLLSTSSMLDTLIVIRRLQDFGLSSAGALTLYGNYTAYCVTLFNLPPVLIYPIVSALIPTVSAYRAAGNETLAKETVKRSLKLASVISLPCSLGLAVMSFPVLKLIFSSTESAEMASPLLSVLAPSVFLIGIMAVTNGILSAYRLQFYSLLSMLFGAVVKGISAYLLVGVKLGGNYLLMYASPISTFLFYFTTVCLDLYFISKRTKLNISVLSVTLRPFLASLLCVLFAAGSYGTFRMTPLSERFCTLLAISVSGVVYLACLFLFGAVNADDFREFPKAEKLFSLFLKKKKRSA